jgi:hypothetical protein
VTGEHGRIGTLPNKGADPVLASESTRGLDVAPGDVEDNAIAVGYVDLRGQAMIPRSVLRALATEIRLSSAEWRILAFVLAAPGPMRVFALAKALKLPYSNAKRTVRGLLRWQMLHRLPGGVQFQPDATRWQPSASAVPPAPERPA